MTNILFICSRNKLRSPTGEAVFASEPGIAARSAGLAPDAEVRLSSEDIEWADIIFVMENSHKRKLQQGFNNWVKNKKVVCLGIPDKYDFMDAELIEIFKACVPKYL
ncbi:phosphotyrosine protein phosphatase [Shewanella mangrovi]|uniref:Phosphotyrosine protein phosphatase n=1 Tax=Shewanella mangrovi TaxID=1515746 RepID=A0A094JYZ9_9GAMM|nr:low molecular weight protein tyrosine phosphatase family protein [Shewanella mangrovi]KFZ37666.1 phosphotyrosine protein phosphatase [Shewanella mangrovi]